MLGVWDENQKHQKTDFRRKLPSSLSDREIRLRTRQTFPAESPAWVWLCAAPETREPTPSVWTRQGLRTDSQPWPLLTGGPAVRPGVCLSWLGARRWLWRDRVSGGGPSPGSTGSSQQGPGHSRSGSAGREGEGESPGRRAGGAVDEAEMKPGPGKGLPGSPPGLGPAARCQRRCDPSPNVQTSPPTQGSHQHAPFRLERSL